MAVDLIDYVGSLKREVAPPGSTIFSAISDSSWMNYLTDAFWEAKLDGFFVNFECDEDGIVRNTSSATPDVSREMVQLIVLYAGVRVLRNKVLNTNTRFRAKSGDVEFEQETGALMLSEMLKQLKAQKATLLDRTLDTTETDIGMFDALSVRSFSQDSYYGGVGLT